MYGFDPIQKSPKKIFTVFLNVYTYCKKNSDTVPPDVSYVCILHLRSTIASHGLTISSAPQLFASKDVYN